MSEDQPHILLIDDEAIALSNMSHVLEREGYAVTACENGESGLAAMHSSLALVWSSRFSLRICTRVSSPDCGAKSSAIAPPTTVPTKKPANKEDVSFLIVYSLETYRN